MCGGYSESALPLPFSSTQQPGEGGGSRGRSRRNATSACTKCRRKRSKCTGPPAPCNGCQKTPQDCCFDYASDTRRKPAKDAKEQRKDQEILQLRTMNDHLLTSNGQLTTRNDELEGQILQHETLLDRLSQMEWSEAREVMQMIRHGARVNQLISFIEVQATEDPRSTPKGRSEVLRAIREHSPPQYPSVAPEAQMQIEHSPDHSPDNEEYMQASRSNMGSRETTNELFHPHYQGGPSVNESPRQFEDCQRSRLYRAPSSSVLVNVPNVNMTVPDEGSSTYPLSFGTHDSMPGGPSYVGPRFLEFTDGNFTRFAAHNRDEHSSGFSAARKN